MKKLSAQLFFLSAFAVTLASCAKDDEPAGPGGAAPDGTKSTVNFSFRTDGLSGSNRTRTVTYDYSKDNFRIFAFKKDDNGSEYVYLQEVPLDGMNYATASGTLSGTAQLPIGEYKFVPTYNLHNPVGYTFPAMAGQTLSDDIAVTHTAGSLPAVYADTRTADQLTSYVLGTTSAPNQTVTATMKRSVSRIDVMFVRADKDAATGVYTPKKGDHIFGGTLPASVTMKFTGLNNSLGLTGRKVTPAAGPATFNTDYGVPDLATYITMGTGEATAVGTDGYAGYDNVQPADIIGGSAHVHGAYVIPNDDNTGTVGLELVIVPQSGTTRTITIPAPLPVQRNMVTLVTVYVLTGNVFTTNVDYEVTVDTVWDGTNGSETEIS